MSDKPYVISSEIDGADLKRKQRKNPKYICCDGKKDNEEISEAIEYSGKGKLYCISEKDWDRIFGR